MVVTGRDTNFEKSGYLEGSCGEQDIRAHKRIDEQC